MKSVITRLLTSSPVPKNMKNWYFPQPSPIMGVNWKIST